ncbi:MAG: nuclear transport factor 2 family protein [Reyranellaceae bacterium]
MDPDAALARYAAYFDTLSRERLAEMDALFAPDARFRDPFNDVRGIAAIRNVFAHMYKTIERPRFAILHRVSAGDVGYLKWRFTGMLGRRPFDFVGLSEVRFNPQGLVVEHLDYWDSGTLVYERVPLLGALVRVIKRRVSAPSP